LEFMKMYPLGGGESGGVTDTSLLQEEAETIK
jgi:hypothetical protein